MLRGEEWTWTIRLHENPETMIGIIALHKTKNHNRGLWLDPSWQRRGLMTEACEAVTDYWFGVLDKAGKSTFRRSKVWDQRTPNIPSTFSALESGMQIARVIADPPSI
jgi:hypothetical protein